MAARVLRAQVVWRLTRLCLYSVLMVLAGNVLLLSLPQVREALWSFDDGEGGEHRRAVFFVVALCVLGRHRLVCVAPHLGPCL